MESEVPTKKDLQRFAAEYAAWEVTQWGEQLEHSDDWGYTYILKCGEFYKFGFTRDLARRLSDIQTSNPQRVSLVGYWVTLCPEFWEGELHKHFHHRRIRREWFKLSYQEVCIVHEWLRKGIALYDDNIAPNGRHMETLF